MPWFDPAPAQNHTMLEEADRLTKVDLAEEVAQKTGLTKKDAGEAVDAVFETIESALKRGEDVRLPGFGIFRVREAAPRAARNPHTGEKINVAAHRVPAFRPGQPLKQSINA